MKCIWDRIHVWLAANAPEVLESLSPGATDDEIASAELALDVTLPEDVKACYRIHNGCRGSFLYGWTWMRLDETVECWQRWKKSVELHTYALPATDVGEHPIRTDWWHPCWIPLTEDAGGNNYCLDLAPAEGGSVGQIITFWHDDNMRGVLHHSFRAWLDDFASELEDGLWGYSEEYDGLVDINELDADEE